MLSLFFSTVTTFLFIRQCVIIYFRKWSLDSSFLWIFFLLLSLLFLKKGLFHFELIPFLSLSSVLCSWLLVDIISLKRNTFSFSTTRLVLGSMYFLLALLFLSSVVLPHLQEHQAVLQIQMTAEEKKDLITWKQPEGPLCSQPLIRRRVIISTLEGKTLFDDYMTGEMASIRIKQLTTPLWIQGLGMPSLWDADTISSDYLHIEDKLALPVESKPLVMIRKNVFMSFLWSFWEKGFFSGEPPFPLGESVISSVYIPLVDMEGKTRKGTFILHLSPKGPSTFTSKVEQVIETLKE